MFGKYARKHSLREIAERDRAYLEWLMTTDFDDKVKKMLTGVLSGSFPKPNEASSARKAKHGA